MSTSVPIVQVRLSYRLTHLPVRTIPPEIVTLTLDSSMSTSARVSSPSPSASIQSLPNLLLLYPLEYSDCTFSRLSAALKLMRAVETSAAVDAGALSAMRSATRTGPSRLITILSPSSQREGRGSRECLSRPREVDRRLRLQGCARARCGQWSPQGTPCESGAAALQDGWGQPER